MTSHAVTDALQKLGAEANQQHQKQEKQYLPDMLAAEAAAIVSAVLDNVSQRNRSTKGSKVAAICM